MSEFSKRLYKADVLGRYWSQVPGKPQQCLTSLQIDTAVWRKTTRGRVLGLKWFGSVAGVFTLEHTRSRAATTLNLLDARARK